MWFTEGNTYGGSERINGTWVGDSQTPMFDDPPKCWLHKQAAWIPDFWPEGKEPDVDSRFFYFPAIDPAYGNPVLGGSDQFVMFNDRPEVRALLQWFSTPDSVAERVATGGIPGRQQRRSARVVHELPDVRPRRDRAERDRLAGGRVRQHACRPRRAGRRLPEGPGQVGQRRR